MFFSILVKTIEITLLVLDSFIMLYAFYYIISGIFAFKKEKYKKRVINENFKIAIIIPARNEENIIGNLIESLRLQNYNKNYYDIFVSINHCTDNTEEVSKKLGAKIIKCSDDVSNKGEVLKYSYEYLMKNETTYDAYVVFDSDNVVHPNFLKNINLALCKGYDVVQGYRDSKNYKDGWISSCYTLFYMVQNYFFNRARVRMNFSSSINGTGFAITRKVLEQYGFDTYTITEDIEYAGLCSLRDIKIYFEENAITYDEQPTLFKVSWKQRKRWSKGTLSCMKLYSSNLIKNSIKKSKLQSFDMALFYMAPVVQILTFISMFTYFIWNIFEPGIFTQKLFVLIVSYIFCVSFSVMTVILKRKKIKDYLKGVFMLPIFMITWIPINIMCLFIKNLKWEKIEHVKEINIKSIINFG